MTAAHPAGELRECQHPRVRHQHGTRAAYAADRCRCTACTDAHQSATRQRARAKASGLWQPYVPAEPVRSHLQRLRGAGIGIDQIARLSGVPGSTVRVVVYGNDRSPPQQVKTETADRLLAVTAATTSRAARSTVDSTASRSQVAELLAAGWRYQDLATELGRTANSLRRSVHRASVTVQTAHDIACLHRRLLGRGHRSRAPAQQVRIQPEADF